MATREVERSEIGRYSHTRSDGRRVYHPKRQAGWNYGCSSLPCGPVSGVSYPWHEEGTGHRAGKCVRCGETRPPLQDWVVLRGEEPVAAPTGA